MEGVVGKGKLTVAATVHLRIADGALSVGIVDQTVGIHFHGIRIEFILTDWRSGIFGRCVALQVYGIMGVRCLINKCVVVQMFHDVDFSSIGIRYRVGAHPDGRPEALRTRKAGTHFNTPELEFLLVAAPHATRQIRSRIGRMTAVGAGIKHERAVRHPIQVGIVGHVAVPVRPAPGNLAPHRRIQFTGVEVVLPRQLPLRRHMAGREHAAGPRCHP